MCVLRCICAYDCVIQGRGGCGENKLNEGSKHFQRRTKILRKWKSSIEFEIENLRIEIESDFALLFSENCAKTRGVFWGGVVFLKIRSGLFVRENANRRGEEDLDWDLDSDDEGTPGRAGGCNR